MPGALDDPQTRAALAATRAGAVRWLAGGAVALVLAVLLAVATVQAADDGEAGSLLRLARWSRALAAAPWRPGTLRIAGPATMRVATLEGDVDLRLQSTTIWRTRAVQRLDGQDVRLAEVGRDRWVLTADGAGTLYGARRP